MYSPKIKESLIPRLYAIAKVHKKPMTEIVNDMLEKEIGKYEIQQPEKEGDNQ